MFKPLRYLYFLIISITAFSIFHFLSSFFFWSHKSAYLDFHVSKRYRKLKKRKKIDSNESNSFFHLLFTAGTFNIPFSWVLGSQRHLGNQILLFERPIPTYIPASSNDRCRFTWAQLRNFLLCFFERMLHVEELLSPHTQNVNQQTILCH